MKLGVVRLRKLVADLSLDEKALQPVIRRVEQPFEPNPLQRTQSKPSDMADAKVAFFAD